MIIYWDYILVILVCRRLSQDDYEFEASQGYLVRLYLNKTGVAGWLSR